MINESTAMAVRQNLGELLNEVQYRRSRIGITLGGTPVSLLLYVEEVDAVVARAVAAGAKLLRPIQNQFYGDRSGTLEDPFGHKWTVATHIEDVSEEEMGRRMAAMKNS